MHLISLRSVKLILLSVFTISILSALYGVSNAQTVNTSIVTKYPGFTKYTLILTNDTLVQGNVDSVFKGFIPISMAYDPENGYLYVANLEGHDVYVISTENYHVVSVIPVGKNPDYVLYDPQNGYIYVSMGISFIAR